MIARTVVVATVLAACSLAAEAQAQAPIGTWQLVSRTDSSAAGVQPADGPLGADPIAWISYDSKGHVSAQLMTRDRSKPTSRSKSAVSDPNNSAASGGYDAYFGTYELDRRRGIVKHHLIGAVSPADVGRTLQRAFALRGDTLRIWFDAKREDGTPVTRRLLWHRIAP